MFCNKCGTKLQDGAGFCQKCGAKLIISEAVHIQSESTLPILKSTTAEQQRVIGVCTPMCILRFIDAAIWTIVVISQLSYGLGFGLVIWNVIATGVSYLYAVRLLGVCRSNTFDGAKIATFAQDNRRFSGMCVLWYGVQYLFLYADGILFFSIMIEIAIIILAVITLYGLSKVRQ